MSGNEVWTAARYRRETGQAPKPGDELAEAAAPLLAAIVRNAKRQHAEDDLQAAIVQWLGYSLRPDVRFTHAANERRDVREAKRMKRAGVMPGWPDLTLVWCDTEVESDWDLDVAVSRVAFIEVKAPVGSLSPAQRDFRDWCQASGVPWALARSIGEVETFTRQLGLLREVR